MGMPTTAVYILLATLMAPSIVQTGVDKMAAHMFVLYFGMLSMITPPVALAAYAAANISKAGVMETGWAAVRIGWVKFVLPFMFVLSPTLSQATVNVPQVDVEGFEVQLAARITDHLKLDAAYGRTITEMKDFRTSNFLGPRDYSGNRTTYTPPFNLNVAGFFTDADGDAITFSATGFPAGSGLSISAAGVISGTPTQAAVSASP